MTLKQKIRLWTLLRPRTTVLSSLGQEITMQQMFYTDFGLNLVIVLLAISLSL